MKNGKVYLLEVILLLSLSYALVFFSNTNRRFILAGFLIIYAIVTKLLLNKKRMLSIRKKNVLKLVALLGFIYVALLYTVGIYTGYYKSSIKFSIDTLFKYIIPIASIIMSSEYIRNKFINYDGKISVLLNYIIQIIVDLLIYANIYKLNSVDNVMLAIGYVLFASISSNLLYNYIAKRYGIKPNIIYRLLTVLYMYFIPVSPDIHIFFLSFYRMAFPFLIYYLMESFYGETEDALVIKKNKPLKIVSSIIFVLLVIYIGLISCLFKYGALVIGSGSMTGTIDKGDVIIFSKNIDINNVDKGDIIVFNKKNIKIVHRVIDIKQQNNEYRLYTKGDSNQQQDEGYVTGNELYGMVIYKIKNIGLPTIWLHEMFER